MKKDKFQVEGMTCSACQAHVTRAVSSVKGVKDVNVNLLTNSMIVTYDDFLDEESINKAVSNAGYKSYIKKNKVEKDNDKETNKLFIRLISSIIFLIPLFILSFTYMMNIHLFKLYDYPISVGFIEFILTTLILYFNRQFFISGFKTFIHKSFNMDTLVSLGSGIAYIYSSIILFIMTFNSDINKLHYLSINLFFETSAMVPSLVTVGKTLESYSKGKTTSAIKSLMNLSPKEAHIIKNNIEELIKVEDIRIDDIFKVYPGESIPTDGIIISGVSSIDESMLTGESIPVDKKENDIVSQGTINTIGTIICKATKLSNDTTLSQIIKLVDEASSSKAPISRIADKVASVFSPFVIILSILVFIIWLILGLNGIKYYTSEETYLSYAISRAISVLVISCPCALGLATPVAIMVSTGVGARNGIIFKNASSLEETSKSNFIVFDKTGTITKGEPSIKDIVNFDMDKDLFIKYAYSIERLSSHPIALAIKELNLKDYFEVLNFKTLLGSGIKGVIDNKEIYAVNVSYLDELNIDYSKYKDVFNKYSGKTILVFVYDNKIIGFITVADSIKDESTEAILKIKKLGLIPIMLTGDNADVAKDISKEVGIDYYIANVKPVDKQNIVKELKKHGCVIMVGDGINDSIALSESNVGIAIGNGTDVAIDSADVVVMKSNLSDAYKSIVLSYRTLKNIKENLFWAFIYNLIMIPIASGVFAFNGVSIKPWYGALAMSLSSVSVVLNALRLNRINFNKGFIKKKNDFDINKILSIKEDNNMEIKLNVSGMMCGMCKKHVESACLKVSGVKSAIASLEESNVIIECDNNTNISEIKNNITEEGYKVL